MSRADKAEEIFRKGYNCSQAVFAAFADVVGMDEETALKIASPFGAGIGKLREVCGAVSGMTMVAGMMQGYNDPKDFDQKAEVYRIVHAMAEEFRQRQDGILCRELLGLKPGEDAQEPQVRTEEYYHVRPCLRAVRDAADIAEKYLLK